MTFDNIDIDEEIRKWERLKELTNDYKALDLSEMFVTFKDAAKAMRCSERILRELANEDHDFPIIKLGKPVINKIALNEYTQKRIVMAEQRRGLNI